MTPDDLKRIANQPGYGTGRVARDKMAALSEVAALLPPPLEVPLMVASATAACDLPMAHFGCSNEDGMDWGIHHDVTDEDGCAFGQDAKTDAILVAAIINAYRMGLLVMKGGK